MTHMNNKALQIKASTVLTTTIIWW